MKRLNAPRPAGLPTLKERADRFIHHAVVESAIVALILLAVGALLAEPAFAEGSLTRVLLESFGTLASLLFAIELSIRYWVAPVKMRFFQRYWLDILAVLPLARPLRLLRVFLLLRLFRAGMLLNRRLSAFGGLIRGTLNEMTVLTTLSLTVVLVGAVTLQAVPGSVRFDVGQDAPELERALWFSVYTLIGGEPIGGMPSTELGRAVTLALMVGGLTVFGMFVGAVSASMITILSRRLEVGEMELDELRDHIIVCGWNPAGPVMLKELFSGPGPHAAVVVVTERAERPPDLDLPGVPSHLISYHSGDYTRVDVLQEVGVRRARAAYLLTDGAPGRSDQDRDARTVLAAHTIERMNRDIFCCAELINGANAAALDLTRVEEVVVRDWYAGVIIGSMGRNRGLSAVLNDILSSTRGNAFHKITVPPDWDGQAIGALHQLLKERHGAILVSWEREVPVSGGDPLREVEVNPHVDRVVSKGDVLVVIAATAPRA